MSDIYDNDELTPVKHSRMLANQTADYQHEKYMRGDEEHGGRLWRKPLLGQMLDEATDQLVYIQTYIQQMQALENRLVSTMQALESGDPGAVHRLQGALNIVRFGNPESEIEEERSK